jgi:Ca2+-binding RTX toxin-like protein
MALNLITNSINPSFRDRSITETQNYTAFAALHDNGTVSFWGRVNGGGNPVSAPIADFSALQEKVDQLIDGEIHHATKLFCSGNGFAAIREDGLAVMWLNHSSEPLITENGKVVSTISTDVNGFCGIYTDGTAFYYSNGEILNLQIPENELAIQVSSCAWGFNVITNLGSVINIYSSNKSSTYDVTQNPNLNDSIIVRTFSTENYFLFLSDQGIVFDSSGNILYSDISNPIVTIATNNPSQVGITGNGDLVSLMNSYIPENKPEAKVISVTSSVNEFLALYNDGSITRFGSNSDISYTPESELKKVIQVVSSWTQFALLLNDGTVLQNASNEFIKVDSVSNAVKIYATSGGWTDGGFAALTSDGGVITWGDPEWGGDSSSVAEQLVSGVVEIYSNGEAFAARKQDGSVIVWGGNGGGGASYTENQNHHPIVTIANYQTDECLYLTGTSAADEIIGGENNDILLGLDGDDLITAGLGNDLIFGGNGNDTVNYEQATSNLTINLTIGTARGEGSDTLLLIENVIGGSKNDIITGNDASNEITSGAGNDLVDAGAGDDLIVGGDGAGNDTYNGGTGIDTIKYTSATAGITVNLGATSNQAKSTLSGNKAGIGIDQLSGIENVIAGKYNDIVKGNTGVNVLNGGAGNDTLDGSTGNDVLKGGTGKDVLYGGSGADKFVFDTALNQSTNLDTIKDFARKSDKIVLDDDTFKAFTGKSGVSSNQLKVVDKVSQLSGDGYLTYVRANDTLYYDANGKGSGDVAFVKIELAGTAAPSASDFQVIA